MNPSLQHRLLCTDNFDIKNVFLRCVSFMHSDFQRQKQHFSVFHSKRRDSPGHSCESRSIPSTKIVDKRKHLSWAFAGVSLPVQIDLLVLIILVYLASLAESDFSRSSLKRRPKLDNLISKSYSTPNVLPCRFKKSLPTDDFFSELLLSDSASEERDRLKLGGDSSFDVLCPRNREEAAARGRQCLRKCRIDADCISTKKRCLCDDLCGWSCVRPDLNCDEVTPLKNGDFKVSGDYFGAKVSYSCKAGFFMSGPRERTCQGDGSWSEEAPICREKAMCGLPPTIPHARHNAPPNVLGFADQARVHYTCFPGYDDTGISKEAKCLYFNETAQWYGPDLKCIPRSCGYPGEVENGVREGNQFTFTSKVTYSCNEGFYIQGRANRFCQSDGQWSGRLPECVVECDRPEDPENGKAVYTTTNYRSLVRYECRYGFRLIGPESRICGPQKLWEANQPECVEIDCGSPGILYNGFFEARRTTLGSSITFDCYEGMVFSGSSRSAKCLENGTWSAELPSCYAPCLVPEIMNGYITNFAPGMIVSHGTAINATCIPLYELQYASKPSLCHNGTWTVFLKCVPARCKQLPEKPKNGLVLATKTDHGSKAIYKCLDGYTLVGSNSTHCHLGKWSKTTPKCQEVYCPFPGFIEHGRVLLVGHMGNYDYRPYVRRVLNNKQIMYECEKRYILVGSSGATCVDGKWSPSDLPKCVKSTHPTTPCKPIQNNPWMKILVVKLGLGNDSFPHGTIIQASCISGYSLNIGNNKTLRCSRGFWKPRQPECLKSPCALPIISNGHLKIEKSSIINRMQSVKHNTSVTIVCERGFDLVGPTVVRCWQGNWSVSFAKCLPSECSLSKIANGRYIGLSEENSTISHGLEINYECNDGYIPIFGKVRCEKGQIVPDLPNCGTEPLPLKIDAKTERFATVSIAENLTSQQVGNSVVTSSMEDDSLLKQVIEEDQIESKFLTGNEKAFAIGWCFMPQGGLQQIDFAMLNLWRTFQDTENVSTSAHNSDLPGEDDHTMSTNGLLNVSQVIEDDRKTNLVPGGTKIVLRCVKQHKMNSGFPAPRTTWTITCENGEWIGKASSCEEDTFLNLDELSRRSCTFFSESTLGQHVVAFVGDKSPSDLEQFSHGTDLIARCDDIGKFAFSGSRVVKCLYGEWEGDKPECMGLSQEHDYALERPPTILFRHHSGSIAQSNDGKLVVYPGTVLHLECLWMRKFGSPTWTVSHSKHSYPQNWTNEPGRDSSLEYRLTIFHALQQDSGTYTCTTPVKYRHSVDIVVKAVHCPDLKPLNGLSISSKQTAMNSKIFFTCPKGTNLNGVNQTICLPSGNWSDLKASCVNNTVPREEFW